MGFDNQGQEGEKKRDNCTQEAQYTARAKTGRAEEMSKGNNRSHVSYAE